LIWAEIAEVAWKKCRLKDIASKSATIFVSNSWQSKTDKPLQRELAKVPDIL
jgi:hypothetical protein